MSYTVFLKRSAEKELERLPAKIHDRIVKGLISLKEQPRSIGVKKLRGKDGYRLRVGDYRILYVVNDEAGRVDVFSISHRREVYR